MAEGGNRPIRIKFDINPKVIVENNENRVNVIADEIGQVRIAAQGEHGVQAGPIPPGEQEEADKRYQAERNDIEDDQNNQEEDVGLVAEHVRVMYTAHEKKDNLAIPIPQDARDAEARGIDRIRGTEFIKLETARQWIYQREFRAALAVLNTLTPSQEQQFMMAECYCQLEQGDEALKCIKTVKNLMASSMLDTHKVMKLVDGYIDSSLYVRALILVFCCANLYKLDSNPNNSIYGIRICSWRCKNIIKALVGEGMKFKNIASTVGLDLITDMLQRMRSISGVDENEKAAEKARCLNNVGQCYYEAGDYGKEVACCDAAPYPGAVNIGYYGSGGYWDAVRCYEEGIELMKKALNPNHEKHRVFGFLLHNMGMAYERLREYSAAESFYEKSYKAKLRAEDWPSEAEKKDSLSDTQRKKDQLIKRGYF